MIQVMQALILIAFKQLTAPPSHALPGPKRPLFTRTTSKRAMSGQRLGTWVVNGGQLSHTRGNMLVINNYNLDQFSQEDV